MTANSAVATTFEGERKLYNALRMKLLSAYPPSVYLLLADGRMVGVFPTVKEADEHARLQRVTSWIVMRLGDELEEHVSP